MYIISFKLSEEVRVYCVCISVCIAAIYAFLIVEAEFENSYLFSEHVFRE